MNEFLKYMYKWIGNVWQETQAIHMGIHPGSYVEVNIPWMTGPEGYTTTVHGQLLLVDATTSLQYRSLVECETFEVRTKTDTAVLVIDMYNLFHEFTCMLDFFDSLQWKPPILWLGTAIKIGPVILLPVKPLCVLYLNTNTS